MMVLAPHSSALARAPGKFNGDDFSALGPQVADFVDQALIEKTHAIFKSSFFLGTFQAQDEDISRSQD